MQCLPYYYQIELIRLRVTTIFASSGTVMPFPFYGGSPSRFWQSPVFAAQLAECIHRTRLSVSHLPTALFAVAYVVTCFRSSHYIIQIGKVYHINFPLSSEMINFVE